MFLVYLSGSPATSTNDVCDGTVQVQSARPHQEEDLVPLPVELGCGYADFIGKVELERRREILLPD